MDREFARKMRTLYGVFFGALTILVAATIIFAVVDLYFGGLASGGQIYSRETVSARLLLILPALIVWLIAAVYGYTMSVFVPCKGTFVRKQSVRKTAQRLKGKIPQGEGEPFRTERKKLTRYEGIRIAVWTAASAFCLASAVIAIVYLANTAHFSSLDVNGEVVALVKNVLPWMLSSLLLVFAAMIYDDLSAKREVKLAKNLIVLGKGAPLPRPDPFTRTVGNLRTWTNSDLFLWMVRSALLVLGILFFVLGIVNGGASDVFIKAINICTECIGLG